MDEQRVLAVVFCGPTSPESDDFVHVVGCRRDHARLRSDDVGERQLQMVFRIYAARRLRECRNAAEYAQDMAGFDGDCDVLDKSQRADMNRRHGSLQSNR